MPQGDFVKRWVEYASEYTEAPEIFHKYMAYLAVSVTLGRRAWIPWPGGMLFPNLYILVMAKSASYKSTAANMIKRVIRRVDNQILIPDDFTDAGLNRLVAKFNEGLIAVDEFAKVLKAEEGHFTQVKNILTSIYDCPEEYILPFRVQDGVDHAIRINYPVFSVAASAIADTVMRFMDIEDMRGGFKTRFIYVTGEGSGKDIPLPKGDDEAKLREFAESLKRLRDPAFFNPARPISFSPEAEETFTPWYKEIKKRMYSDQSYSELSGAINRLRGYAVKFAILDSVVNWSTQDDHPVVRPEHMTQGIEMANSGIENLFSCMSNLEVASSKDKNTQFIARAREFFKTYKEKITRSEIYSALRRATKRDINMVIETLLDSGEIEPGPGYNGKQTFKLKDRQHSRKG